MHLLALKSGGTDVIVNIDKIDYIRAHGQTCTLMFGPDHSLVVDVSAYEIVGKMQDAKPAYPKG